MENPEGDLHLTNHLDTKKIKNALSTLEEEKQSLCLQKNPCQACSDRSYNSVMKSQVQLFNKIRLTQIPVLVGHSLESLMMYRMLVSCQNQLQQGFIGGQVGT